MPKKIEVAQVEARAPGPVSRRHRYQVLTRRADGHETVLLVTATSKAVAIDEAVARYSIDRADVVEANPA